nr:methyl-accepting chemotaxis protein [Bacillus coahuilensis]
MENREEFTSINEMNKRDIRKKNLLMFITFSLSLVVALGKVISSSDYDKIWLYGSELILFFFFYFILFQVVLKKAELFPITSIIVPYGFTIASLFIFETGLDLIPMFLFLMLISGIHLKRSIFIVGYVLGAIGLFLSYSTMSLDDSTRSLYIVTFLVYLLSGVVLGVMIYLNRKQNESLQHLMEQTLAEAATQEERHIQLTTDVTNILDNLSTVNAQVQTGLSSQEEMRIAINEVATGSQTQSEQISDIADHAKSTKNSMKKLFEVSSSLGENATSAKVMVSESEEKMTSLTVDMNSLAAILRDMNASFKELTETIQETNSFTGKIKEITDQTNLLALNASIEAARAGEAGRGFAVVAEEIRKLAEMSSLTTDRINENLLKLNQNNEEALEKMSTSTEYIEKGQESTRAVSTAFGNTVAVFENLSSHVQTLLSLAEQVNGETVSVEASTNELAAIIEQSTASLEEMTATIETLTNDQQSIAHLMGETSRRAESIIT